VTFGQESKDEMATLTFGVTTADLAARRRLAEASLRRDLEKNGWDAMLWVQLATVLREQGRPGEALEAVREALQRQPANAAAHCEHGLCLEVSRDVDGAERAYREALRIDEEQSIAAMQLGGILGRSGRTEEAIGLFERALRAHPNLALLHSNAATAYFVLGKFDVAETHYRRSLQLDAANFGAWLNLGRVLAQTGRKDEARTALQRAAQLRPGDAAVARALDELGRQ
jgi:tetratricopeptide (TPR) repeat protein